MVLSERYADLELEHDISFQRKDWAAQRIGWVIMGLVVLAAMLGLLGGSGPLSSAVAVSDDGSLRVEYLRFIHLLEPNQIQLEIERPSGTDELRIGVNNAYLNYFSIDSVLPEPDHVEASDGMLIYVFQLDESARAIQVVFDLNPVTAGSLRAHMSLDSGSSVEFDQIIYP